MTEQKDSHAQDAGGNVRQALAELLDMIDAQGRDETVSRKRENADDFSSRVERDDVFAQTVARARAALVETAPHSPAEGARQIIEDPFTPNDAWDELVNKDDRTSPEEYPDMCLISFEELKDYIDRAVSAWLKPDFEGENRQLRTQVDLLERNAGIQAKLLADTGRERDQALSQVKTAEAQLDLASEEVPYGTGRNRILDALRCLRMSDTSTVGGAK